jgi:hypothetical protein
VSRLWNPGRAVVCTPPAPRGFAPGRPWASVPSYVLGHLNHHVTPQCPEETWMMVSEVSLSRVEELLFGIAREARPALAICNSSVPFGDGGHVPFIAAAWLDLQRPAEGVGWKCPGVHCRHDPEGAL